MRKVIGYKAFNKDMTCTHGREIIQFEVGKTYEVEGQVMTRKNGYHFCFSPEDCLRFYPKGSTICRIIALGIIEGDGLQYATNKIYIDEVLSSLG